MIPATLKTQQEILNQWHDPDHCTVSICMLAYNHEPYVQDALHGVLEQETDFAFEALIHDDASNDRTAEIIRKYAAHYPRILKPIYQRVNQLSQGVKVSLVYNFSRVTGDYIAMCECDDFWTDNRKLAKQVEAMKNAPDCHLCFHPARQIDCSSSRHPEKIIGAYGDENGHVPAEAVILRKAGVLPTASCMITREAMDDYVAFRKNRPYTTGDLYMQFFGARHNGAVYLNDIMSVYRWCSPSSWTRDYRSAPANGAAHELAMIRSYRELDSFTGYRHRELIRPVLLTRTFWHLQLCKKCDLERYHRLHEKIQVQLTPPLNRLARGTGQYIIYGIGIGAELIAEHFPRDRIVCIVDRDDSKHGTTFQGHPVVSLNTLPELSDSKILISLFGRSQTIIDACTEKYGISEDRFVSFDQDVVPLIDIL